MENLPAELNVKLFVDLDYPVLVNLCSTNTQIYDFCQDEYIWEQKLLHDFPDAIIYKPKDISYQEQYHSLYYLPPLNESLKTGRLDQIVLHKELTSEDLNIAAANGHIHILDWAFERLQMLPYDQAYYHAAINNRYVVLDWLYEHNITIPNVVDKVYYQFNTAIINVMKFSSLPIFLWLENHGYPINLDTANAAAGEGPLDLVRWIWANRGILPDEDGADMSVMNDNRDVLHWLKKRGILPSEAMMNYMY